MATYTCICLASGSRQVAALLFCPAPNHSVGGAHIWNKKIIPTPCNFALSTTLVNSGPNCSLNPFHSHLLSPCPKNVNVATSNLLSFQCIHRDTKTNIAAVGPSDHLFHADHQDHSNTICQRLPISFLSFGYSSAHVDSSIVTSDNVFRF